MKVITLRGIGEQLGNTNMLAGVTPRIFNAKVVELPFKPSYGFVIGGSMGKAALR